jgi:hypothetical protein
MVPSCTGEEKTTLLTKTCDRKVILLQPSGNLFVVQPLRWLRFAQVNGGSVFKDEQGFVGPGWCRCKSIGLHQQFGERFGARLVLRFICPPFMKKLRVEARVQQVRCNRPRRPFRFD